MTLKREPLVSVVIPVYNGEGVLRRAIRSVLSQSYENREIIVVDDGSTDSTASILEEYRDDVNISRQNNSGTMAARNLGAAQAKGKYIAFLDQDDYWDRKKLELQVNILEEAPNIGLTFGNLEAVDDQGNTLGFMVCNPDSRHPPTCQDLLLLYTLYPSSALLRRELFQKTRGFDTRFASSGAYGDQDFHIRLRELTHFRPSTMRVGYYFWNLDSPTRAQRFLANLPVFAEKYSNHRCLVAANNEPFRKRFVQKIAEESTFYFRTLLRHNGNIASYRLLTQLKSHHDQLKQIFADIYPKATGLNSLDLQRFALDTTLSTILFLYLCRRDLQDAFLEVHVGDLKRLLRWAHLVSLRIYLDIDDDVLSIHRVQLLSNSNAVTRTLARIWTPCMDVIFQHGVITAELLRIVAASISVIRQEGVCGYMKRMSEKVKRRTFTIET